MKNITLVPKPDTENTSYTQQNGHKSSLPLASFIIICNTILMQPSTTNTFHPVQSSLLHDIFFKASEADATFISVELQEDLAPDAEVVVADDLSLEVKLELATAPDVED